MENKLKKLSWVIIGGITAIIIATLFGILALNEMKKAGQELNTFVTIGTTFVIISGIVSLISAITTFFTLRSGGIKTSIISLGRYSRVQNLGALVTFVLALIGLIKNHTVNNQSGIPSGMMLLIISFVVALSTTGFAGRGLKAFRKDKESYMFICVSSFISAVAFLFFLIVAAVDTTKIGRIADIGHAVGFAQVYCVFAVLVDVVAYFTLGVGSYLVNKHAPNKTLADEDSESLKEIKEDLSKIAEARSNTNSQMDNISKLREYKRLLDEGVITQEEFETKKKELL